MSDTQPSYIGRGIAFPLRFQDGSMVMTTGVDDIDRGIRVVLSTAPGERVMRPTFGAGLADLVFAPNTPTTHGLVASSVRSALVEEEPRIDVLDVVVGADPAEPTRLLIEVDYTVRATNSRFNLVYPFYLQQPA